MDYPVACDLCKKKPNGKEVYLIKVRLVQAESVGRPKYITLCADCHPGTTICKLLHTMEVKK